MMEKTLNMAKINITTRSSVFMHRKKTSVTIQGNITTIRYWNDVIRYVLLLQISANFGMMLARDYASCHMARNTLVMLVAINVNIFRWPAKKSGCKSYWPLVRPIETQGLCTSAATKSQGVHMCYSSDVCGHSTTVYS